MCNNACIFKYNFLVTLKLKRMQAGQYTVSEWLADRNPTGNSEQQEHRCIPGCRMNSQRCGPPLTPTDLDDETAFKTASCWANWFLL